MNEEQKRKQRNGIFWNAPNVKTQGDPNIRHPNWNPHENEEYELEYE